MNRLVARLRSLSGSLDRWFGRNAIPWREHLALAALAVGGALALWMYVVEDENPRVEVDVAPPVRVRASNVPEGLAVLGLSEPVSIRASAPRDSALRLNGADFRASVDLEGRALGTHDVPMQVEYVGGGRRVRVEQVLPGRVRVTLQPLQTTTVSVRLELASGPPTGFELEAPLQVGPASVRVAGAEDLVSRVVDVVARVDLSNATKDTDINVDLVATNGSGTSIEGVVIDPNSVRVHADVRQTLFERSFAVTPRIRGNPATGYSISTIEAEPLTVVLQGPLATLERLEGAQTDEIDVSGAVGDIVQQARLSLPPGVRNRSAAQTVQVRIRISPTVGRATFGVAPTLENTPDGAVARSVTPLVEVEVEGPLPQLRSLGPTAFTAVVNLSGLGPGRHDVPVSIRAPSGIRVITTRPERVVVDVTR